MRFAAWPTLALLLAPSVVFAQQDTSFKNVEYLSGMTTIPEKQKGMLVVSAAELRLVDKHGKPYFTIPMSDIRTVRDSSFEKSEDEKRKSSVTGIPKVPGFLKKSKPNGQITIATQKDSVTGTIVLNAYESGAVRNIATAIRSRLEGSTSPPSTPGSQGTPQASQTPAADAPPLQRMLVANPFAADPADSAAAVEVGTGMRNEVSKILGEKLQIITREQMNKLLEPYGYPADAILSQSLVVTLATSIEASVLLSGNMTKGQDGRYSVSARLGSVNDTTGAPTVVVQEPSEKLETFGRRIIEALKGPQPAAATPAP